MNTNKLPFIFLVVAVFFCNLVTGYQAKAQNKFVFKGRIVDSETNQPLSFVSIGIPSSGTGVISNEFGEFNYHVPENFESHKIQISLLGYKKVYFNISELRSGVLTMIKLDPEIHLLKEITVNVTPAIDVVNQAIRNIRKNYPKGKTLLYGYYRDYISPIDTHHYKNLIEAAIIIEDKGFNTNDINRTKVKLEQLRYHPGIELDSSLNQSYGSIHKFIPETNLTAANELSILRAHNPIRNHDQRSFSFVDIFDEDFVDNHKFEYELITQLDSVKVICIRFEKYVKVIDTESEYLVNGQIFIHSKSYAILKFIYSITCNTELYTGKFFDIKLEYKNMNDKYYLSYLSLSNYFEFNKNPSAESELRYSEPFYQYRELFVNKIVTERVPSLKSNEIMNRNSPLSKFKVPVKNGFWENYNYTSNLKLLE
jgi:hypothetical protein